jgi:ubiquitin-conjugating enzyme E2 Q
VITLLSIVPNPSSDSAYVDTSEYPKSHSVFCYSPDGNLSAKLQRIVDEIAEEPPRSLGRTVRELVVSVAQAINTKLLATGVQKQEETDIEDMDSDEGDDYNAFDEDDDIEIVPPESNSVLKKLQA